jgi:RNA polymerase sigma-70 factor (ECF subfamily)
MTTYASSADSSSFPPTQVSIPRNSDEAFRLYFAPVWRNLRRLGVRFDLLDDACQDVFLVVHRRWGEQANCELRTWVFGISVRVASEYRRRKQPQAIDSPGFEQAMPVSAAPDRQVEVRQASDRLQAILDRLKRHEREIFTAVELEQMTVPEAAKALNVNLNTAYTRLRAARASFEELLRADRFDREATHG